MPSGSTGWWPTRTSVVEQQDRDGLHLPDLSTLSGWPGQTNECFSSRVLDAKAIEHRFIREPYHTSFVGTVKLPAKQTLLSTRTMATDHTNQTEGPRTFERLALLIGVLVSAVPAIAFLAGRLPDHFVVNSDYLLLPELLADLAAGGSVDRWVVPYATYIVPDWPLYSLALLITPSATLAVAAFAFMQALFLFAGLRRLARVFDAEHQNLLSLIGLAIVVLYASADAVPLVYLATAYTHFGTVILLVFALAFTLDWIKAPQQRLVWASVAVSAAAVLSDRLFVLWFLVPAATAIAFLTLRRHLAIRDAARWLVPHVIASVAVLPAGGLLFPNRSEYDLTIGFSDLRAGTGRFIDTLQFVTDYSTSLVPLIGLCVAVVGWRLWRRSSFVGRGLDPSLSGFLALYFVISAGITAAAQIMMSGDVAPGPRYSLPILILPLVLVGPVGLAGLDWNRTPNKKVFALAASPVVVAIGLLGTLIPAIDTNQSPVPSSCIDAALAESGSSHGIASYWDARTVEVFSNGDLEVAPYGPLLFESHINAGLAAFAESYDFAVTSEIYPGWNIDLRMLDAASGPPQSRVTCERWTISDWGPGGLRLAALDNPGDQRTFTGCTMSSHLAEPTANCQLRVGQDESTREYLVFGPFLHVPPGEYEVTASYSSSESAALTVGEWDITADTPTVTGVLASGTVAGSAGSPALVTTTFVVPSEDDPTSMLQWRLVTSGSVDVVFDHITVTRIR